MTGLARTEPRFIAPMGSVTRQVGPPTVSAAVPLFVATVSSGRSPRTGLTYRTGLHRFCEYLQVVGIDPDETLTTELPPTIAEEYVVALGSAFKIKATAAAYTASLKAFLRWAYRRRWGPVGTTFEETNLAIKEVTPRFPYRSRPPHPRLGEVVKRVLELPEWPDSPYTNAATRLIVLRDRALFVLLLTSGLRVAELVSLDRSILTAEVATVVGKGSKERVVMLSEPARVAIGAYLAAREDASPALFLSHHRSGHGHGPRRGAARPDNRVTGQGAWDIVRRHGAAAGIPITPHAFRHKFAQDLRKSGVSLADISEILGHSSVHVTHKIYARIDVEHLHAAYARYTERLATVLPSD